MKVADGRHLEVLGKGSVVLECSTKNGQVRINLVDVLYAPRAEENLLSVGKAGRKGAITTFGKHGCTMVKNGNLLFEGVRSGTVYKINGRAVHPGSGFRKPGADGEG